MTDEQWAQIERYRVLESSLFYAGRIPALEVLRGELRLHADRATFCGWAEYAAALSNEAESVGEQIEFLEAEWRKTNGEVAYG